MLEQDSETGNLVWQPFAKADSKLIAIVNKLTEYHFRSRYSSAIEVLRDLADL
jgi:hypothetical protein